VTLADLAFALVPPGSFQRRRDGEAPQSVYITKAVNWQIAPVTVGLYRAYRTAAGLVDDPRLELWVGDWRPGPTFNEANVHGDDVPVVGTSYSDALDFIAWLSQRDSRPYRLPTEAEFEHAARAGCAVDCHLGCLPKREHDSRRWPDALLACWGSALQHPNGYGIHGLSGVIWQWCSDWYAPYPSSADISDPRGPQAQPASSQWKGRTLPPGRVIRGGSWSYEPRYSRCDNRHFSLPADRNVNLGFRLVADAT
jgi:formylglycine-generating enzyme required for sulfatase activity